MSKTVKVVLAGVIVLVLAAGLIYTGIWIGRYGLNPFANRLNPSGWGMVFGRGPGSCCASNNSRVYGRMGGAYDQGLDVEPLSIHEVEEILDRYLDQASDPDLYVAEIMVFDNHAYAQIVEKNSGIGAMEVLVDYQTQQVYPEQGPNMIWNLKYSPMASAHPGMMGSGGTAAASVDLEDFSRMPVSAEAATGAAQEYLDRYQPGMEAEEHSVMFYGYYTLHVLDGDEVAGMLSVNGYSGQVFYHHWHGNLLETEGH